MRSGPIHRSDTQKESDDQHYLIRLLRTQTRAARLKDRTPSPIVIPTPSSPNPKADPFLAPHFSSTAPLTVAQPYHPYQPAQPPTPAPAYEQHQSSNVAPARAPTPTPPVPKRPDASLATGLGVTNPLWCSSSTTLLEIDVLEDLDDIGVHNKNNRPNEKQELDLDHDLVIAPVRRSSYNYRTGAGADLSEYNPQNDTMDVGESIMALRRTARDVASAAAVAAGIAQGTSPTSPRLPQPLQDPEQVLDEQWVRHSRQEQMLKRSSQLFPVHHHHQQHELQQQGSQQQEAWKPQWRRTKNTYSLVRASNGSSIGSDLEKEGLKSNEMTKEEQAKLEELLQKKKRVEDHHNGLRPSMDGLSEVSLQDDRRGGTHERMQNRGRWLDRPSCCIPLGYMLASICMLTLAFNGPLGILVFKASRFSNNDADIPLVLFSFHFIFGGAFFFFGFIYLAIFAGGYNSRRPRPPQASRASYFIFRFFHALYFLHALVTFGCMMAWLGMNKSNTGSWDRMYLKAIQGVSAHVDTFSFEALLPQDPDNPEWRMINPYIWIVAFAIIFVSQLYFWVCLVAYGRKMGVRRQLARGLKF
ncbi:hypothetical protein BGZ72_010662 [Mortierella alpina]|nr:hypothetical protein BGZ72_010662 [Mortierella alpina]